MSAFFFRHKQLSLILLAFLLLLCTYYLDTSDYMWKKNWSLSRVYINWLGENGDLASELYLAEFAMKEEDYQSAFRYLKPVAAAGDGASQFNLYYFYRNGLGVEKNLATAMEWLKQSALAGYPSAQMTLGLNFVEGSNIPENVPEGVYWLIKANQQGVMEAQYFLSQIFERVSRGKYSAKISLKIAEVAANSGNGDAEYLTGMFYQSGIGTEQDFAKAAQWYQLAVDQHNNPFAMNDLAMLYATGNGVKQDNKNALSLFYQSAKLGDPLAMYNIGLLHLQGSLVKQDYHQAYSWYHKAAILKSSCAANDLGYLYANGYGVDHSEEESTKWYRKAVLLADEEADFSLSEVIQIAKPNPRKVAEQYAREMYQVLQQQKKPKKLSQPTQRLSEKFYSLCWE